MWLADAVIHAFSRSHSSWLFQLSPRPIDPLTVFEQLSIVELDARALEVRFVGGDELIADFRLSCKHGERHDE